MKHLMIDPGTPFGWSFWKDKNLSSYGMYAPKGPTWQYRSFIAGQELKRIIERFRPDSMYCERPIQMGGHSRASDDNLIKLCLTVGRFIQICDDNSLGVELIDASWLGQLKDNAIRYRVGQMMERDVSSIPEHAIDSVAMGLFVYRQWPKG